MAFDHPTNVRKRKIDENDFTDETKHKMLLTEEKLIKNLQTLSLDFPENKSTIDYNESIIDDEEVKDTSIEFHLLLKDNIKRNDVQDEFIRRLYNLERKKFSLQLVPYMPVHPAQLKSNKQSDEQKSSSPIASTLPNQTDDHLFKKPFLPTPYTVEEPCDTSHKRTSRMKRSYSQSIRSNSNISIVELRDDIPISTSSSSDYLIFEPHTPSVCESSNDHHNKSIFSLDRPTICITEYNVDCLPSSLNNSFDDSRLSDTCDLMDDETI